MGSWVISKWSNRLWLASKCLCSKIVIFDFRCPDFGSHTTYPFDLCQFVGRETLPHHGKQRFTAMQGMNASHKWRQPGQNCANILHIIGFNSDEFKIHTGEHLSDLAQEVDCVGVEMTKIMKCFYG